METQPIVGMQQTKIGGINILHDNDVPAETAELFVHAYYKTVHEIMSGTQRGNQHSLPLGNYQIEFVFVTEKDKLQQFTKPGNKKLEKWVLGYVVSTKGRYVRYVPADPTDTESLIFDLASSQHEIIHILLPEILEIPREILAQLWNTWVNEGIAVGMFQLQTTSMDWIKHETQNNPDIKQPSIASIQKNGIFWHDHRRPATNVAYQWCALVLKGLETTIKNHYPDSAWFFLRTPFDFFFLITQEAYQQGISIEERLAQIGIDTRSTIFQIEAELRQQMGIN